MNGINLKTHKVEIARLDLKSNYWYMMSTRNLLRI